MLKYTGNALVDVGAAAVAAMAGKRSPEQVTEEDVEEVAKYLEEVYSRKYMSGYLVCVFPNSAYVNPTAGAAKRNAFLQEHLYAFRQSGGEPGYRCGLCGLPAKVRGYRQHVPMITGEGVLNFFPNGAAGLPLCAACMLSTAAMPMGALRCSGRALLVHADDPTLTFRLARENVQRNTMLIQLHSMAEEARLPDAKQARTRLIERLCNWASEAVAHHEDVRPTSVTAYHLTNSGKGPDLDIYHLPSQVISFLIAAEADPYRSTWHRIVARSWWATDEGADEQARRSYLYDDVVRLPRSWSSFVRTYFLRRPYRFAGRADPRAGYNPGTELDLIDWGLTSLFLERVVSMEQIRVDAIRKLGDRLADYIATRDAGFWNDFNLAKSYSGFRVRLIRASKKEENAKRAPLITFEDFITVFEHGEDSQRTDWTLARDLTLIRVIDKLHERRWFEEHPDAAESLAADAENEKEPIAAA